MCISAIAFRKCNFFTISFGIFFHLLHVDFALLYLAFYIFFPLVSNRHVLRDIEKLVSRLTLAGNIVIGISSLIVAVNFLVDKLVHIHTLPSSRDPSFIEPLHFHIIQLIFRFILPVVMFYRSSWLLLFQLGESVVLGSVGTLAHSVEIFRFQEIVEFFIHIICKCSYQIVDIIYSSAS